MVDVPWAGVPADRVVAVLAELRHGRVQWGSGFLIGRQQVLTAWHCTIDKESGAEPLAVSVIRRTDGAQVAVADVVSSQRLDVAVLRLAEPPWPDNWDSPGFGRVDRRFSGRLTDCQAVGYPLFQRDPADRQRNAAELHGTIRLTEDVESGFLVLRDADLRDVHVPESAIDKAGSPWGGLSGALVFHRGLALGVVVEHHPRQGSSAIRIVPMDRIAGSLDADGRRVADALSLPADLRIATDDQVPPLAGLVDRLDDGDLPLVADLNPYQLGASVTVFGDRDSYGEHDPYVPRTRHDVDTRLRTALTRGQMALVVGPSKAGKTRTAFEAVRDCWPDARLVAPEPSLLHRLVAHPRIASSADRLVIWLDDLQRFLTPTNPVTPALLSQLIARPGPTIVLATLRQEERARLLREGALTRNARQILEDVLRTTIDLASTMDDPDEQAAAAAAYPSQDLSTAGLAERLAGAPTLLQQYRDARAADPMLHAVLQTAIDWARVGMVRPIGSTELTRLAVDLLAVERPELDPADAELDAAIRTARTPPEGAGRVAALRTFPLPQRMRGYRPFDYLIAADDGQVGDERPVPDDFWDQVLALATTEEALHITQAAEERELITVALKACLPGAEAGDVHSMLALAELQIEEAEPPLLDEARAWLERAVAAGEPDAMARLGELLADEIEPAEPAAARALFERAAEAGNTAAMCGLASLAGDQEPPDRAGAIAWYRRAAELGDPNGMLNLANQLGVLSDPPDLEQAWRWLRQADVEGMSHFAVAMLAAENPQLVPESEREAWHARVLEAGDADRFFEIGRMCAQSPGEGLASPGHWYEHAATVGHVPAMIALGVALMEESDPPQPDVARSWFTRAAEAGDPVAMYNLGILCQEVLDPPDLDTAAFWYVRAAENDMLDAMVKLMHILPGLDRYDELLPWLERYVEATGDTGTMLAIALILLYSIEPRRVADAVAWLRRAAEAGDVRAMEHLAFALTDIVEPADPEEAQLWLERAAEAAG
ncbi:bifunctional trypsin-like peptidase domain-containing/SEL1-like repeat protein [Kutzneria chonburiensis]|uniref:Trypsin-like peptidase domain-containing protein n=1 Tax=Kutzneria chonburiensis TaxID=1483604 RepID=A0ABV6MPB7_9PSEU|nr:bifunctional trypsin-like peptidase domain-containing/SEL1-like repeat protein [Kutzneria chonburiensis]